MIGQSLGRYHILEQIGEGGMATVYKAFDTRLERDVAVKVIRVDQFAPAVLERILKRFEREAKSLARLSHPNIVHINDYGEHEGVPYLVMDYLPGGTLKEKMGRQIPWAEATRLLLPVAHALAYAHKQGVIHRDVKPNNILIAHSGDPMLTDFGIAKLLDTSETQTLTGSGVGIGTPEYMAPEQGLGKEIDGRADIYALGVVLYEMVTGRKPFTADTPMAVVIMHVNDPLPRPSEAVPDLPDEVENVLIKALAKKPENRYVDMESLCKGMENLLTTSMPVSKPVLASNDGKQGLEMNTDSSPEQTAINDVATIDELKVEAPISISKQVQSAQQKRSLLRWIGLGAIGIALVSAIIGLLAGDGMTALFPTSTLQVTPTPILTPTPTTTAILKLGNGSTITREKDGMEIVYVPEGPFRMGGYGQRNEMPVHTVILDAYWIDKTEVTNAMYVKCAEAGACQPPSNNSSATRTNYYNNAQYANYPVVFVNWIQANAYCGWAGGRLPSEAEWEKAARGTDVRFYPWGNDIDKSYANYDGTDTARVGSYEIGKSPYGAYDMAGNVWEWVADWFGDAYYQSSPASNPPGPTSGGNRVLRGGGLFVDLLKVRSTLRDKGNPADTFVSVGFRCARSQ